MHLKDADGMLNNSVDPDPTDDLLSIRKLRIITDPFCFIILYDFFEKILPSDFMHIFHDFIHVYSLSRGRQPISMSTERPHYFLILYTSFHDLINVYSPGAGADNPQGTNFLCQQKNLVTGHLLQV